MEFIQKAVFSSENLSKGILAILSAVGESAVKKAFEGSKEKARLERLFKYLDGANFYNMNHLKDYKNTSQLSFMSMEKALQHLNKFEKTSRFYGGEDATKRKFYHLLESLNYIEADLVLRLILKKYDIAAVECYLFPERIEERLTVKATKRSRVKKNIEENENLNENNELQDSDENVTD